MGVPSVTVIVCIAAAKSPTLNVWAAADASVGAPIAIVAGSVASAATSPSVSSVRFAAADPAVKFRNDNPPIVSKWGGLTNPLYTTDTVAAAGNLVITEIHYHPADPSPAELAVNAFWGDNDFEFLELRNLSEGTISLAGCQFTLGVTFSFTGDHAVTIPAGGYVILSGNVAAFIARYGAGGTVVGPFTGSLSNGGETLRLLAANNSVIQEITYDDAWWPDSDGAGKSLVVYQSRAASCCGNEANWRASAALGGSPRAAEPNLAPEFSGAAQFSGTLAGAVLAVTVTDDGQPETPGAMSLGWSALSGPGTVQFTPADAARTTRFFRCPAPTPCASVPRTTASPAIATAPCLCMTLTPRGRRGIPAWAQRWRTSITTA